jgi:signal transduction histidine kinase
VIRLKSFFKQHTLWLVMFAVAIPLLIITYLQYRSLVTLGTTLPVYRKQVMREYLGAVSEDAYNFYKDNANATLSVPADFITNRKGGIIQEDLAKKAVQKSVGQVADYFKDKNFKGARRYFIVVVAQRNGDTKGDTKNVTLFYDAGRDKLVPDDQSPEWRAIQVAFAPYYFYIVGSSELSPMPMGIDRDPNNLLIVKPILEDKKIVGLAGMVLNQEFFLDEYLPQAIQKHQQKFLAEDAQDAVVTLRDEEDTLLYSTAKGKIPMEKSSENAKETKMAIDEAKDEVSMGFGLVFRRMHLGVFMRHQTEAEWKKQYVILNLSLLILMMLLLIGGVAMALKTASREMKLSRMKADFVSNVSHELRTPLASIRVFGEFLKLGRVKEPRKIQEYGEYIETESRRLTQLINNILDFSRIESGQKTYHFEDADLTEIVDETLKSFDVRLSQHGFSVNLEMPEEPLPLAKVDSAAIAQALVNLLDNAAKYSGEAKEIDVRVAKKDEFITIAIIDRGIGIPPQEQEKIFEKFYRVSTGLVHDVKGSGLGLSIVKHIIEAHQGKVTVRSKPGNGTTFTIYLPIHWVTGEIKPIFDSGIHENDNAPRTLKFDNEEELLLSNNK